MAHSDHLRRRRYAEVPTHPAFSGHIHHVEVAHPFGAHMVNPFVAHMVNPFGAHVAHPFGAHVAHPFGGHVSVAHPFVGTFGGHHEPVHSLPAAMYSGSVRAPVHHAPAHVPVHTAARAVVKTESTKIVEELAKTVEYIYGVLSTGRLPETIVGSLCTCDKCVIPARTIFCVSFRAIVGIKRHVRFCSRGSCVAKTLDELSSFIAITDAAPAKNSATILDMAGRGRYGGSITKIYGKITGAM
jgi:hypothetical protein